mgnify:FL=1
MYPEELRYGKDHEWARDEGDGRVRVGITHYAQQELGDVVFVELPETETTVEKDDGFAVVESVKAVSDIYAPVSGTIVEVNTELETNPELINEDPYGKGWIAVIAVNDPSQLNDLMTAAEYREHIGED